MREQIGRLVHQDEHDDRRGCDHRGEAAVAHFHAHALLPVLIVHCRPSCSDAPICSIFGQCACSGPISSIISSCSAGALATSCLYSVGDIPGSLRTNATRSEEHTSELQSLMRISYAVFCLKKKTNTSNNKQSIHKQTTH